MKLSAAMILTTSNPYPTPSMKTIRVSIDLITFQQLCRGEISSTTGASNELEHEVPVELALQDVGYDQMLISVQKPTIEVIEEHRLIDQDVLLPILDKMDTYGGSFVKQLAAMTRRADPVNRVKCLLAWSNYFLEYHKKP